MPSSFGDDAQKKICEGDGKGLLFPLLDSEQSWNPVFRAFLYSAALIYIFLGVNIVADKFMTSIEAITKVKLRVRSKTSGRLVTVKRWNDTVANLTLMALGSSAPEILLSIMEIVRNKFRAGALGPSTIVGSAAFNLFVIIAVCMWSIPSPEIRSIEHYNVFIITAVCSIIAYLWLVFIVQLSSPDVVTILEGCVTLVMFPILVLVSYLADIGYFAGDEKDSDFKLEGRILGETSSVATREFLYQPTAPQAVGKPSPALGAGVDLPGAACPRPAGVISFEQCAVEVDGDDHAKPLKIRVLRSGGTDKIVACKYRMEGLTALPGYDYYDDSGSMTFGLGVDHLILEVTILPRKGWEKADSFQIILEELTGDAAFSPWDDGGENSCILTVTIQSPSQKSTSEKVLSIVDACINVNSVKRASVTWKQEIVDSLFDYDAEDGEDPTPTEKLMHVISMPWKFSCALLIPPADYAGGTICFVMALVVIGGQTAIIIDFAELFGCVTGVADAITAITFVALGTSMPDLFASKIAAVEDDTADASIVNVTGSNSVNVFLGIGIPWTMAAVYWKVNGETFIVEGGDLGFSVMVFIIAAIIAFAVLRVRRVSFDGELGGPFAMKAIAVTLFVLLWVFYIFLSCWKILNPDADFWSQVLAIALAAFVLQNIVLVIGFIVKKMQASGEETDLSALEHGVLKSSTDHAEHKPPLTSFADGRFTLCSDEVEPSLFDPLESIESSEYQSAFSEAVDLADIDLNMQFSESSDATRAFRKATHAIMATSRLQKAAAKPPLPPPPFPPSDTMPIVVGTPIRMSLPIAAWAVLATVKMRRGSKGDQEFGTQRVDDSFAVPTGAPVAYQPISPAPFQAPRAPRNNVAAVSTWFALFLGRHVGDFLALGACFVAANNLDGMRSIGGV